MQVFEERTDSYFYERLIELYPNKEIKALVKRRELYVPIKKLADERSISVKEYCNFLGFKYGKDARAKSSTKEEKLRASLLELYPDRVVVGLIKTDYNLYGKAIYHSQQKNMEIGEYIISLGFEIGRAERSEYIRKEKEVDPLEDLKNIQGLLDESTDEATRLQRSRQLVIELKKLYSDGCQLCADPWGDSTIPRIKMKNGQHYVEVHHIQPLSTLGEIDVNDESRRLLDSYKNVIVVCSHHHKVLHYEKGGYTLNRGQNKPYFVSEDGHKLLIHTNFHL